MSERGGTQIGGVRTEVVGLPLSGAPTPAFRLAGWVIRPALNRIDDSREQRTLEPRCMHVLLCLAHRPGDVVSRTELLDTVWSDVTVGEEVLTRAISQLRSAFDDDTKNPRFIETIRGGGYRLVAPVEPGIPEVSTQSDQPGGGRMRQRLGWAAGIGVVSAVVVAMAIFGSRTGEPDGNVAMDRFREGTPVTTAPGQELFPAVSPSGGLVVFSYDEEDRKGLFLTQPGADRWLQLTDSPGADVHARWSADGSRIAFERRTGGESTICTVAALGGPVECGPTLPGRVFGMDWVPNANSLVLCASSAGDSRVPLKTIDLDSWSLAEISNPDSANFVGDSQPRFDPKGRRMAFVRCDHAGVQDIWIMPWPGGEPFRVTHGLNSISGVAWSRDGESLIVSARPDGRWRLWRIFVDGGDRELIPTPDIQAIHPALDRANGSVVYVSRWVNDSIWRVPVFEGASNPLESVAASSRRDWAPSWSADGLHAAFVSNRSGSSQIWVAEIGSDEARQVTRLDLGQPYRPYFAPDGRRLAFSILEGSTERGMVLDMDSGRIQRVPAVGRHDFVLGWTSDGRLVARTEDGIPSSVVIIDLATNQVEAILMPWQDFGRIQVAGGRLFFDRVDASGVWMLPLDGGEAVEVVPSDVSHGWTSWAACDHQLFFSDPASGGQIGRYDTRTGQIDEAVAEMPASVVTITPSPDGSALLAVRRMQSESDLVSIAGIG